MSTVETFDQPPEHLWHSGDFVEHFGLVGKTRRVQEGLRRVAALAALRNTTPEPRNGEAPVAPEIDFVDCHRAYLGAIYGIEAVESLTEPEVETLFVEHAGPPQNIEEVL